MTVLGAVGCTVFALSTAAQAEMILLYQENFVTPPTVASRWTYHANPENMVPRSGGTTPDGDGFYMAKKGNGDRELFLYSSDGVFTLTQGERVGTTFEVDFAKTHYDSGSERQSRFIAKVDGVWYGSDPFGTVAGSLGNWDGNTITEWAYAMVDVESANWYPLAPITFNFNYGGYEGSPQTTTTGGAQALPEGTITNVGLTFGKSIWNRKYAADNFRVSVVPEPSALMLLLAGVVGLLLVRRRK